MAGARSRKLDLSGYLDGSSRTASIIANTDQSGGIGGLLNGIAGGVTRAGVNMREDKQRGEDRAYRAKRDAFSDSLALKADARAERDQTIQEDEYKRKVAAEAKAVEETTHLLSRAQVAGQTGMPMDPKVLEEIQKRATVIQAAGGVTGIMAKAAALEEPDIEGLISQTSKYESLAALLTQQMGREKNPARHAALGDAFMQLSSIVGANKYRLRLYDENSKRRGEVEETRAKAAAEAAVKAQGEKAELDAFNKDLVASGGKPVSSLEYGKMRERERGIDERTQENITLRREVEERRKEENDRKQDEVERENRAREAVNTAVLEIRKSAEARAVGKVGFDVEKEIDRDLAARLKSVDDAINTKNRLWKDLVAKSPKDPERSRIAKEREHLEVVQAGLLAEQEKRASAKNGLPVPDDDYPGVGDRAKWKALTPEQKQEVLKRMGR